MMNRSIGPLTAVLILGGMGARAAWGQAEAPAGEVGVRVSETAILHAGVTAEAGYDTNVFYNDEEPVSSGILRVTPWLEVGNTGRGGSPRLAYSLGVSLAYREYLNEDPNVKAQRGFNPTFSGSLAYAGTPAFGIGIADSFTRTQEPPYGPSEEDITRIHNLASARVRSAPGGGRIAGVLQYSNGLDYYENPGLRYATNMGHGLVLDLSWKWLPKTALYLQGGIGWVDYLNEDRMNPRFNSFSYSITGGLRGLITPKLAAGLGAGYADAFYQGGDAEPGGSASIVVAADLGYQIGLFTRLGLSYGHGFRNSPVIGNFYEVDTVGVSVGQSVVRRIAVGLDGRWEYRRYQGFDLMGMPLERNDHVVGGTAHADFYITPWMFAGVGYAIVLNESSLDPGEAGLVGVDFMKHQIFGRLGVRY